MKNAHAKQEDSVGLKVASPAALNYGIYSKWKDNKAKTTVIRWGTPTWGWRHVQKHNVSLRMIQKTTQFPNYRTVIGNTIVYRTPATKYKCWVVCVIEKTIMVREVVSNNRLNDGYHRGVITTYCEGVSVGPNWVREVA